MRFFACVLCSAWRMGITMFRKLLFFAGAFCLIFAFIPAVVFGIVNIGVGVIVVLGLALILLPKYWAKISKYIWLRNIFATSIAIASAYIVIVSIGMASRAYLNEPPSNTDMEHDMVAVVLGGGLVGDQPSLMLSRRLDVARDYMQRNVKAVCVVTGGQGPDEIIPEAVAMKNYLVARGIDENRIFIEDKSTNTRENFLYAMEYIPNNSQIVIMTDGFHQLRASIFAKSAGLENSYSLSSKTPWGLLPSYWLREMLGIPVALLLA